MPAPDLPTWATNATYATGLDVGLATRLEPTSGEKADGIRRKTRAPGRKMNWLLGLLCDWVNWLRRPCIAWVSLDNIEPAPGGLFTLQLATAYQRDEAWAIDSGDDKAVIVPEPGIYRVLVNAIINRDAGDGAFVEMDIALRTSAGVVGSAVGQASGYRYDDAGAMPARVTGGCLVEITDPDEQRIVFKPATASQTPVVESGIGQLHQIYIEKIGELSS